ncbi:MULTISPECIES: hypothetical protein [Paenibacillus]|uniref:Uncharacterized protein n=1 Tax=Paenibacillus campinasensis TaxID=66347 RepID=A0A268ERM4_9BACL|nr:MULTISPECIES: hypothetical protein [Paenibacillus]MUG66270.1 hypothetical protein [Paenibacillus campinasensis]PAD75772.1 hypothetical protein CHH67_14110 [Paenibacillus campinasensis]PAK54527.1 hypothetical protein CHH75_06635 [Paenibacillus sp. 7541]
MLLYIMVITLALIGGIATMLVGLSQENRKSNPEYERKTKNNIVKLVVIYLIALIGFITIWALVD